MCVCVCVCVTDLLLLAAARNMVQLPVLLATLDTTTSWLLLGCALAWLLPTHPTPPLLPPPRPHPHTYVQHLWTLLHHYGSAQQLQRLARAKSIRRSLFDQILMAIAPDPKVWLCFVLRVCVWGGGVGVGGEWMALCVRRDHGWARVRFSHHHPCLCVHRTSSSSVERTRDGTGQRRAPSTPPSSRHVPNTYLLLLYPGSAVRRALWGMGDGGGGGGGVTTPPVLEGKLMHNMMTLHPASGNAGC